MYDNTSKLLIRHFCADYTRWLLSTPVELVDMEPTELYYEPIRAVGVVLLKNDSLICHWEFQTDPDLDMAYRNDQIFQEGEARGKRDLLIKLLTRRVGVLPAEMIEQVDGLSLERVEDLGVALLDFTSIDDLLCWLGSGGREPR